MAAAAGVDDVVLIAALALHRRMTEAELRHALGDRVYEAFAPHGLLTRRDTEDPDNLVDLGVTRARRWRSTSIQRPPGLRQHQPGHGQQAQEWPPVSPATGASAITTTPQTMRHSRSFMDQPSSELHSSNWRMGRPSSPPAVNLFSDRDHAQRRHLPRAVPLPPAPGVGVDLAGSGRLPAPLRCPVRPTPRPPDPALPSAPPGHDLGPGRRGGTITTTRNVWAQQGVGQADILSLALPYICPYNVNSIMNPIVACLGLGYFFNLYRGRPLVREERGGDPAPPDPVDFHPAHHPSYIDFFDQVLAATTDPVEMHKKYEESYATDPWYVHLYRTGHAYHGVHPFYMWYWCAHALEHVGRVVIVGGDPAAVRRMGFSPASTLGDALEMASDVVGTSPTLTHLRVPPLLMADVR